MSDPSIQLIANLVVTDSEGRVLLTRYDPEPETDVADAAVRWWLPGRELTPYQHPDQAAAEALAEIVGITVEDMALARVQSFRGRRGWHVSFDYRVSAHGVPDAPGAAAAWHSREALPRTMHGPWERETIAAVIG